MRNFTIDDIYFYIFSWKKVTENALEMFDILKKIIPNCYFVNCDENYKMSGDHVIQLDDSYYYGGQFETALRHCPKNKILGICVGDADPIPKLLVDIKDYKYKPCKKENINKCWKELLNKQLYAINKLNAGVVAPYTYYTAQTKKFDNIKNTNYYNVPNTDCTFWFLHPEITKFLRNFNFQKEVPLGWGIDILAIKYSRSIYKRVLRDYSYEVSQPQGTNYNSLEASTAMRSFLGKSYEFLGEYLKQNKNKKNNKHHRTNKIKITKKSIYRKKHTKKNK